MFSAILIFATAAGSIAYLAAPRAAYRVTKRMPRGAWGLVGIWLTMLFGMGLWMGKHQGSSSIGQIEPSAALQVGSVLIALVFAAWRVLMGANLRHLRGALLLLFLYAAAGMLSSPLSLAPQFSLFKAASLSASVLIAALSIPLLRRQQSGNLLLNLTYYYFAGLVFLALIGGLVAPDLTHKPNNGIFRVMLEGWPPLNSNTLGSLAAIVAIVGFRRMFERGSAALRRIHLGLFVTGLCTLLLAQSRTSIAALACALIFLCFCVGSLRHLRWWLVSVLFLASVVLALSGPRSDFLLASLEYLKRGTDLESMLSLTGRLDLWDRAWNSFLGAPLLGNGFHASAESGIAAHNAYLTVLMNSGLFGFLLWISAILGTGLRLLRSGLRRRLSFRSAEDRFLAECLAVAIILALRTVTGSDLTIHAYSTMILLGYLVHRACSPSDGLQRRSVGSGGRHPQRSSLHRP